MALRKGVVKADVDEPVVVASARPPVELAYHLNVPLDPDAALIDTVPGLHEIPSVAVTDAEVPIVATTAFLGLVHAGEVDENET